MTHQISTYHILPGDRVAFYHHGLKRIIVRTVWGAREDYLIVQYQGKEHRVKQADIKSVEITGRNDASELEIDKHIFVPMWSQSRICAICSLDELAPIHDCSILEKTMGNAAKITMPSLKQQEGGDHYKKLGEYQPWAVFAKWMTPEELKGYAKGTAIAYLCREADKGGRLDIKKAVHTLQLYLELSGETEEK